jgi:hypothetical protein
VAQDWFNRLPDINTKLPTGCCFFFGLTLVTAAACIPLPCWCSALNK